MSCSSRCTMTCSFRFSLWYFACLSVFLRVNLFVFLCFLMYVLSFVLSLVVSIIVSECLGKFVSAMTCLFIHIIHSAVCRRINGMLRVGLHTYVTGARVHWGMLCRYRVSLCGASLHSVAASFHSELFRIVTVHFNTVTYMHFSGHFFQIFFQDESASWPSKCWSCCTYLQYRYISVIDSVSGRVSTPYCKTCANILCYSSCIMMMKNARGKFVHAFRVTKANLLTVFSV